MIIFNIKIYKLKYFLINKIFILIFYFIKFYIIFKEFNNYYLKYNNLIYKYI